MPEIFKIEQHQTRTLKWWNSRRDRIDFDPPYQRKGRLWSPLDKAYLIDSILNGFDIPKLYLADFQYGDSALNEKRLPYAIIDGKQRLEAIFDFFDNRVTLDKHFIWRPDPNLRLGGLSLKDLQNRYSAVAEEFENANLTIMSVYTDDETLINDLFVRLNRSKSLTGAEIRNAFSGPVVEVIRNLSKHVLFEENIKFSTLRAGDQNAAAKVLLFEYRGELTSTKKSDLDEFAKETIDQQKLELAARRVIDTFDEMRDVFIPNDPLLSSAGVFPVYYWLIREIYPLYQEDIRPFLVWFESQRKENRDLERLRGEGRGLNQTYSYYDTLNRSTNDGTSHIGRHKVLREQFYKYLNDHYEISGVSDVFANPELIAV
jgi:hypothetical protein